MTGGASLLISIVLALVSSTIVGLPVVAPAPAIALSVWIFAAVGWWWFAGELALARRYRKPMIPVLYGMPFLFAVQVGLDDCMPYLGSALVLFGNFDAIAAELRANPFPTARIHRC